MNWVIPVLMTYPDISLDIPKKQKTDRISRDNSKFYKNRWDIPG